MRDSTCVFCKIVEGQIPAMRVYEDDAVLAFLDIGPLAEGHLVLIPRDHYVRLEDMPDELLARVAPIFSRLARAVQKVSGADAYNLLQNNGRAAGQEVMHVHFHIIPRKPADGLGFRWKASKYEGDRGRQIAEQLIAAMKS